jgi:hypothetical protein
MEPQLRSGWGTLLKPLAWQGALCHAPGAKTAFTRPDTLSPDWRPLPDPDEAAPRAVAAYLSAYGPASPEAFSAWLLRGAHRKTVVRKWFADAGLAVVDVEGRDLHLPADLVDDLAAAKPVRSVHLLGAFDQYILGPGTAAAEVLDPAHRARVSKAAGWIAPLLVHAGRVTGTWEATGDTLAVTPFPDAPTPPARALKTAVARLAAAMDRPLTLA